MHIFKTFSIFNSAISASNCLFSRCIRDIVGVKEQSQLHVMNLIACRNMLVRSIKLLLHFSNSEER